VNDGVVVLYKYGGGGGGGGRLSGFCLFVLLSAEMDNVKMIT